MKTAISMADGLFGMVDQIAKEERVPRSRIFVKAITRFIKDYRSKKILDALNAAYEEEDIPEDEKLKGQRKIYSGQRLRKDGPW